MSSIYDHFIGIIRRIYKRRLTGPPVLDVAAHFAASDRFVGAWQELREEALDFAKRLPEVPRFHELMPQQAEISAADGQDWRMLLLKAYGVTMPRNMARCPILASLLKTEPDVLSASISFLAPGKHIPAHQGPFRGVIRYYLGLSVPLAGDGRAAAVLRIADSDYRIGNGECLLWDDTYTHEVWNRSSEVRVALLLDIRRRGMPIDMELLTRLLIAIAKITIRINYALNGSLRKFAG